MKPNSTMTAEQKAKISAAKKAQWSDPNFKESSIKKLNAGRKKSEAFTIAVRAMLKDRWTDPEKRAKVLASFKASDEKRRANIKKSWQNAEVRNQRITGIKAAVDSPEYKQKMVKLMRETGKHMVGVPKFLPDHPNALHIKLRDPNNKVWEVHNLNKFVEDHLDLFEPKHREFKQPGLRKAAARLSALTAKKNPRSTSLGWTLVSRTEVFYNNGEDLIERQQHEVHSI